MFSPDRAFFFEAASSGANFIPLAQSWPADLETPLTTWLKVAKDRSPGVLLESIEGGERLGRWSVVASNPLWTVTARAGRLIREWRDGNVDEYRGNPFDGLRQWLIPYKTKAIPGLPPLGQLYGMWGYELIHWIEKTVPVHANASDDPPDGIWMLMDSVLILDQVKRLITAVAYGDLTSCKSVDDAYEKALKSLQDVYECLATPISSIEPLSWQAKQEIDFEPVSNFTQIEFEKAVSGAREHISAGDVFQLVLSQRLEAQIKHDPLDLYRSLRMVNPSPYMAFFDFGDWQLIGSSPEVMVKAEPSSEGIRASLRPIAGTRPRGKSAEEDNKFQQELLSDPKECAEHVMLVDLGRNDLGRVCIPGSVEVKELMVIEKYSHVMHIVSEVEGTLSRDKDVWDLLMASFPAGTVSGAPKIRAMQLLYELESQSRGPYSGVYGSMDLAGALNTAITIRTMVVRPHADGGLRVQVQAGAGIVADSIPKKEYQETLNKAKGMLTALACLKAPQS